MRKNEVEATNQQLFLEPEWAIDSEAIRARGIIVLVRISRIKKILAR